jgi:DNA polymerase III epsilon subunit-like protein
MHEKIKLWIDFETGGVEPHHSPLSFAMIATKYDQIIGEWYTQIRQPPLIVDQKALEINQIDLNEKGLNFNEFKKSYFTKVNEWFYNGSNFIQDKIYPKIKPNKDNMPLMCAWNIQFDRPILHKILESTYDGAYYHTIDPMILTHTLVDIGIIPKLPNYKLETVSNFLNIKPEGNLHNALTDVKTAFEVYKKLKSIITRNILKNMYKEILEEKSINQL